MYNRYIPQSDGTHRRKPTPDSAPPPPAKTEAPKQKAESQDPPQYHRPQQSFGITNFFRQILPANFDIGDLIVVLLLLLMAADRQEDQNNALLTLALYLFL